MSTWKGFRFDWLARYGIKRTDQGVEVPYFTPECARYRIKLFTNEGPRWIGESKPLIPYGLDTLRLGGPVLFLTEGESCALALRHAYPKTPVLGIPGANSWKTEWREHADRFEAVYLSFDRDDAGERLTKDVLEDLPEGRTILLPTRADTRDVLQLLGRDSYRVLIEDARYRAAINRAFRVSGELAEQRERVEQAFHSLRSMDAKPREAA